jgi:hypothetical protein
MTIGRRIAAGIERGPEIEIIVDGERVAAYQGESVAAALIASGRQVFRRTARHDSPRGVFCGMGICFDCLMTVNGVRNVRTCVTPVEPEMRVETQRESEWLGGD